MEGWGLRADRREAWVSITPCMCHHRNNARVLESFMFVWICFCSIAIFTCINTRRKCLEIIPVSWTAHLKHHGETRRGMTQQAQSNSS